MHISRLGAHRIHRNGAQRIKMLQINKTKRHDTEQRNTRQLHHQRTHSMATEFEENILIPLHSLFFSSSFRFVLHFSYRSIISFDFSSLCGFRLDVAEIGLSIHFLCALEHQMPNGRGGAINSWKNQ